MALAVGYIGRGDILGRVRARLARNKRCSRSVYIFGSLIGGHFYPFTPFGKLTFYYILRHGKPNQKSLSLPHSQTPCLFPIFPCFFRDATLENYNENLSHKFYLKKAAFLCYVWAVTSIRTLPLLVLRGLC